MPEVSKGNGNGIPWFQLVVSGTVVARSASVTHSALVPRGAKPHLCQVPVQKSAPTSPGAAGRCPGTCAASTKDSAPISRASAQISGAGITVPVGEVMWSVMTRAIRSPPSVRSANATSNDSTTAAASAPTGWRTTAYDAPVRAHQWDTVRRTDS